MADLLAYLPPFEGLLPKWLFLVSSVPSQSAPSHPKQEKKNNQPLNKKERKKKSEQE